MRPGLSGMRDKPGLQLVHDLAALGHRLWPNTRKRHERVPDDEASHELSRCTWCFAAQACASAAIVVLGAVAAIDPTFVRWGQPWAQPPSRPAMSRLPAMLSRILLLNGLGIIAVLSMWRAARPAAASRLPRARRILTAVLAAAVLASTVRVLWLAAEHVMGMPPKRICGRDISPKLRQKPLVQAEEGARLDREVTSALRDSSEQWLGADRSQPCAHPHLDDLQAHCDQLDAAFMHEAVSLHTLIQDDVRKLVHSTWNDMRSHVIGAWVARAVQSSNVSLERVLPVLYAANAAAMDATFFESNAPVHSFLTHVVAMAPRADFRRLVEALCPLAGATRDGECLHGAGHGAFIKAMVDSDAGFGACYGACRAVPPRRVRVSNALVSAALGMCEELREAYSRRWCASGVHMSVQWSLPPTNASQRLELCQGRPTLQSDMDEMNVCFQYLVVLQEMLPEETLPLDELCDLGGHTSPRSEADASSCVYYQAAINYLAFDALAWELYSTPFHRTFEIGGIAGGHPATKLQGPRRPERAWGCVAYPVTTKVISPMYKAWSELVQPRDESVPTALQWCWRWRADAALWQACLAGAFDAVRMFASPSHLYQICTQLRFSADVRVVVAHAVCADRTFVAEIDTFI